MRRARFTFPGAFHHVMNRGINGSFIFPEPQDKLFFISLLKSKAKFYRIKILAFCIMDNHYHIILQNTSGRLSDFMKQLNGIYGTYYRKKHGGMGYVFQNRFKSTLIQNEKYLAAAILYTLQNPLRANISATIYDYKYSSIHEYFNLEQEESITDTGLVEEIFGSIGNILQAYVTREEIEGPVKNTRYGKVLGDDRFVEYAKERFERREMDKSSKRERIQDIAFKREEEVIDEFEGEEGIKVEEIDVHSIRGKRLRIKLLIRLREESGLRYSEINKMRLYRSLKLYSLSVLFNRHRKHSLKYQE